MNNNSQHIILKYLIDYLKIKNIPYKKAGKVTMVICPFCKKDPPTANILPNTNIIKCLGCDKTYNLIDIVAHIDFPAKGKADEEIVQYIKDLLKLDITTKSDIDNIKTHFDFYVKQGFDLVPVVKGGKRPIEKAWTTKSHKDKTEWVRWFNDGLNVGIKTGKKSNILILDIDTKVIPENLKKLLGNTLVQESSKGFHYFYKYDKDIPKTRIDGYELDIESEGGQVVIFPSSIKGIQRKMLGLKPVIELPKELKKFLLEKMTVPLKTNSEKIREDIQTENFSLGVEAKGKRNSSLIKLGGIIRKTLNAKQTEDMLHVINNHIFETPLPPREISAMGRELDRYIKIDNQELAHEILKYLKTVEHSSKTDIELAIYDKFTSGERKKILNSTLHYLQKENKIVRRGNYFKAIKSMEWDDCILDASQPVKFKVPYLDEVAFFNYEDMIIIGGQNKTGKTGVAINILKRLVDQKIKPYYIYNETGARFAKVSLKLGMKDGDFYHVFASDPEEVIFEPNSVVVFDWVKPSDFARSVDKSTPIFIQNSHGIKEIIPINDLSPYHNFKKTKIYTKNGWVNLQKVIKHKCDRKMYRLITKTSIVECTEDHSLIINNKTISPKQLQIGDRLEIIEPELINEKNIDIEWAWFHGLISAEGHVPRYYKSRDRRNKRTSHFSLVNNNVSLLERASKSLSKFGIDSEIVLYKSNKKTYVLRLKGMSERFEEVLSQWHINKDGTKKVPHFILNANEQSKKAYLNGYIAGDGNICPDKSFRFGTTDKPLFTGICYILKCLKYNFTVGFVKPKNKNHNNFYTAKINLGSKCVSNRPNNMIKYIDTYDSKDYIYDLQTQDHSFNGGVGDLINLHNTDNVFSKLVEKCKKTHSFLICFVQLKKDNSFFAPNQIGQYPALLCRYLYEKENDGEYTLFQVDAMRDPKILGGKKTYQIPCKYDFDTREVKTISEIKNEE